MDVCESEQALRKHRTRTRQLLVHVEKNNAYTTRRSATSETSSPYRSPSPTPAIPRRCSSPSITRTTPPASSKLLPKRAQSAERKRPATPPFPPRPSTPFQDSSIDVPLSSRRVAGSRMPETLWPSTMRSLSVSFQSDTISIPVIVSKKGKPVTSASDRTLRSNSNMVHKQLETPNVRKPTPERKRSPLKGKNASDHTENSKPVDGLHSRLIDQHQWPSRIGRKVCSSESNRDIDYTDKTTRLLNSSAPRISVSSLRRLSLPGEDSKTLQKASSDGARLMLLVESGRIVSQVKPVDDSFQVLRPDKFAPAATLDKAGLAVAGVRSQSFSSLGSRLSSPSKTSVVSTSSSRGVSPSRSKPSTPQRGVSPSRIRPTNSSNQSNSSISVLSFIADFKKGKKGAALIEDAHQLRLLYNRYLQWRFVNAQAEDVFYIQNATAKKSMYSVWHSTLSIWESIIKKRINLQQLQLELKLNSILNDQMAYLGDWAVLESDHIDALSGAVEDLEASTLRLPLTGEAKADVEQLKLAICSAVDVLQAMGSAICSLFSRVEGMSILISEAAVVSTQEKAMLDECKVLLNFVTAMQVEEYSLWTHLMQIKQPFE